MPVVLEVERGQSEAAFDVNLASYVYVETALQATRSIPGRTAYQQEVTRLTGWTFNNRGDSYANPPNEPPLPVRWGGTSCRWWLNWSRTAWASTHRYDPNLTQWLHWATTHLATSCPGRCRTASASRATCTTGSGTARHRWWPTNAASPARPGRWRAP